MLRFMSLLAALSFVAGAAVPLPGDATRGAQLFKSMRCVECHSVQGAGGKVGPDLSRHTSHGYTPDDLASLFWNHIPQMWSAMEKSGTARPAITPQDASDLFAYFYAARYMDKPGDAAKGRRVFVEKGCAECHNLSTTNTSGANPVVRWQKVGNPIELARQMWNHAPQMSMEMSKKGKKLPQLTAAEMNDVVVYLQSLPQTKNLPPEFSPGSPDTGAMLFRLKGCAECHTNPELLAGKNTLRTTADLAAAMWNHAAQMKQASPLRPEEMTRLVGYLWVLQFSKPGNVQAGQKVYESKGCGACHATQTAPKLPAGMDAFGFMSTVSTHAPAMLKATTQTKTPWPQFKGPELGDLLAYLSSR